MKTLIVTTALALLLTACTQPTANNGGMMSGDMMQNCQTMMKQNDMTPQCQQMMKNCQGMMAKNGMTENNDTISSDTMKQCQQMMKDASMMQGDNAPLPAISPASGASTDHKKHHPAQ